MRTRTSMLLAMLAVASSTAVARPAAAATTVTVNNGSGGDTAGACASPDFTSIGDALAAASDGDTVRVCAGTYHETLFDYGHSVTLEGAQAGNDARTRSGPETIIDGDGASVVTLYGYQSVIDGFTLQGADGEANEYGVQLNGGEQVARNNIYSDDATAVAVPGNKATVERSVIPSPAGDGTTGVLLAPNNREELTVRDNAFTGSFSAGAVSIQGNGDGGTNLAVADNTASISSGHFLSALNTSGLSVSGNTVTGTSTDSDAISLTGMDLDFSVTGNHVTGFGGAAAVGVDNEVGSRYDFAQDGSVSRNDFRGNGRGLRIGEDHGSLTVTGNVFGGNASGAIDNGSDTATVVAPENFYGCNTGPNTSGCDSVSGTSTPASWLVLSPPGLGDAGASPTVHAGQHYTFTADLLHDNSGAVVGTDAKVPDGVPIVFGFDRGSVAPVTGSTTDGSATTTFTPGTTAGPGRVTATLANAQAYQDVLVDAPAPPPPAVPAVRITGASVREGNSGYRVLAFAVTLDHAGTRPVSVRYATENGTAHAPSDYIGARGSLSIPAGQTRRYIYVIVRGDRTREATESFRVHLSGPVNATLATATAVGRIINDD